MYPCCIFIALLLLCLWGARDKLKVLLRHMVKKARREQTPSLKEELRQAAYIAKKGRGTSDGRTRDVHL